MSERFYMPSMRLIGAGCIEEVPAEIKELGLTKALIVTDKVLNQIGLVGELTKLLEQNGIQYAIYDGVQPNQTVANVNNGLAMLKEENCDFVISFGGGSSHDCCKGIALLATNGGVIGDYEGVNRSKKPQLPMIAVNTTAGTASEMTIFCIITDEERHVKMALVDKNMTPIIAVNDANLMLNIPKALTAATGMDALTHAVEAYVSTNATPVTDACAQKAIELITKYLRTAVHEGKNVEARENMAYAEYLAGMAFNNASLGYVHAMAHQLGGMFDLPHGVCNAVLLPHVQEYNAQVAAGRLRDIAKFMGADVEGLSEQEGARKAIDLIKELSKDVEIPSGLDELKVPEDAFDELATNALKVLVVLPIQSKLLMKKL